MYSCLGVFLPSGYPVVQQYYNYFDMLYIYTAKSLNTRPLYSASI